MSRRRRSDASTAFLRVSQVADHFGVTDRVVRKWMACGLLAYYRFPNSPRSTRIARKDLEAFAREHFRCEVR